MRRLGIVVLDVNVLVSLVIGKKFARLIRAIAFGRVSVVICPELLEEWRDVLHRPHLLPLLEKSPEVYLRQLKEAAVRRTIRKPYTGSPDPDDDYLVALCLQEKAWLVSGDGPLLRWSSPPPGLKRMTYTEFQKRAL